MSCEFADRIDLDAYLVEPGVDEWAVFRAHYPDCAECSALLAGATAFEEALAQVAGTGHPESAELASLVESTLSATRRAEIDEHVRGCASCRDSLAAFEGFRARVAVPAAASAQDSTRESPGILERLRVFLGSLTEPRSFGAPAWTAATLALIAVAYVLLVDRTEPVVPTPGYVSGGEEHAPGQDLERTPEAGATDGLVVAREDTSQGPSDAEDRLEGTGARTPGSDEGTVPLPPDQRREAGLVVAEGETPAADPVELARAKPAPADPVALSEPILVAMANMLAPRYVAPDGAMQGVRVSGAIRGRGSPAGASLFVLAPDHAARTASAAPTLYWFTADSIDAEGTLTLLDEASDSQREVSIGGGYGAGIHALRLSELGLELEIGHSYRWYVSFDTGSDYDLTAGAVVERVATAPGGDAARLANLSAEQGLWYDALEALSTAIEAGGSDTLRQHRIELLEQGGLPEVADYERHSAAPRP